MKPVALSIAGSDSGGGAGIQADLRSFSHFSVFGVTALTAVTAQNPGAVTDVHPIPPASVSHQMDAIFAAFTVRAIKTGMLFSTETIQTVASALTRHSSIPLVVDPVMVATSGSRLLRPDAVQALCSCLLPLATVVTPNLPEAEIMMGEKLPDGASTTAAARVLATRFGNAVVIKGGHDADGAAVVDTFSDGRKTWRLACPLVAAQTTHGTGCSLSAAMAACLAQGMDALGALTTAKQYVTSCLSHCAEVGPGTWAMQSPPVPVRVEVTVEAV